MSSEQNIGNFEYNTPRSAREILGVDEDATRMDIQTAFKQKMLEFSMKKDAGQKGEANLLPEETYDELLQARHELLGDISKEGASPPGSFEKFQFHKHEKSQESLDKIWTALSRSPEMLGILAFLTTGNFLNGRIMSLNNLDQFFQKYPTEKMYEQTSNINQFLDTIRLSNGVEVYQNFKSKAGSFKYVVFPE